jgi:hypothetical protein
LIDPDPSKWQLEHNIPFSHIPKRLAQPHPVKETYGENGYVRAAEEVIISNKRILEKERKVKLFLEETRLKVQNRKRLQQLQNLKNRTLEVKDKYLIVFII